MLTQSPTRCSNWSHCSTNMANTILVPKITTNVNSQTPCLTVEYNINAIQQKYQAPKTEISPIDCMPYIRKFYSDKGFSREATNIICSSWRKTTLKQYEVYFKKWSSFCHREKLIHYDWMK